MGSVKSKNYATENGGNKNGVMDGKTGQLQLQSIPLHKAFSPI